MPHVGAAGGGSTVEHFRYVVNFTTTATTATDETVALSSVASGATASSGVSLASNIITLPVGKWILGLTIDATYASALPTFGDFHMGIVVASPHLPYYMASLDHQEYDWTGQQPTFSGSNFYNIAPSQTARVVHYTDSGKTSQLYGSVWGHQIA